MNTILCVLIPLLGTSLLPQETCDTVASIDLMVSGIEDMDLPSRPFLATWPPAQGPGYSSTEVVLREDRQYELVDDMMIETDLLRLMQCSYSYVNYLVSSWYYFDEEGMLILCISTWEDRDLAEPLCEDIFYFTHGEVLVFSSDCSPLAAPTGADLARGQARLEHAEYILSEIAALSLTAPPMFMERFDSVYYPD